MFRRLLLVSLLVLAFVSLPAGAAVTSLEVTPESPVQGDVISINLAAAPGEQVPVTITFAKSVAVSAGTYRLVLSGVNVPQTPNSFRVRAEGVQNVVVTVSLWGIPISLRGDASGGVATVSQGGVPAGNYDITISGDAQAGVGSVALSITASTTVTTGADGRYTFNYDTSAIPPGSFTANVGGLTRTGTLAPRSGGGGGGGGAANKAPTIAAVVPSMVVLGKDAVFDASRSNDTDGKIVSWEWDFGDGSSGLGSKVTHRYAEAGIYNVSLILRDDLGASAKAGWAVEVEAPPNTPPAAEAGSDRRAFRGVVVDFDGSGSSDAEGDIASFSWDFGDGGSAVGMRVSHRYERAGVYDVVLTVVDGDGAEAFSAMRVIVEVPPVEPSVNRSWGLDVGSHVVNASDAGVPVAVRINATGLVTITVFSYPGDPYPASPLPPGGVGAFYDLSVSNPDVVDWPLYLEAVCGERGGSLGLYYYDGEKWVVCSTTGYDESRGVVWAWLTAAEAAGSPLTIGYAAGASKIRVSNLSIYPPSVVSGGSVSVSLTLQNLDSQLGVCPIVVRVGGVVEAAENVTLSASATEVLRFDVERLEPGDYLVDAAGLTSSFTVFAASKPAEISLQRLAVSPLSVEQGGRVEVSVRFRNVGEVGGDRVVELMVNGLRAVSQIVSLPAGGETTFTASVTLDQPGINMIAIGGEVVQVVVSEKPQESPLGLPLLLIGVVVAVAVVVLYMRRRG